MFGNDSQPSKQRIAKTGMRRATLPMLKFSTDSKERDAFGHWLSGFVDGEGYFFLSMYERASCGKKYLTYGATFAIPLREDELPVVREIQSFLNCGYVYLGVRPNDRENTKPQVQYRICNSDELLANVVPHFEAYPLRAKKKEDFKLWQRGVQLLNSVKIVKRLAAKSGVFLPKWSEKDTGGFRALCIALKQPRLFLAEENADVRE